MTNRLSATVTAMLAAMAILLTTPALGAEAEEEGKRVELAIRAQSYHYPFAGKEFSFEVSGTVRAGEEERVWEEAMKCEDISIGVGGLAFFSATWKISVPEGLENAVLKMNGPEGAVFQIKDGKGRFLGDPTTTLELGDIEGAQPMRDLSIYCAARLKVTVVDEEGAPLEGLRLSGMVAGKNARNFPMTATGDGPGVFASEASPQRISVVVTKEGYAPQRLVVDCGNPGEEHARRVVLKKLEKKEEEEEMVGPDGAKIHVRRGRAFVEAEEGRLAWGQGYPVKLAVRLDPPKEKYRIGDILSRSFLIHNVSDRSIEFNSRASLGYFSSDFKKVVPGGEVDREDGEFFDTDEGVFQQMDTNPKDENIVRHVLAPGEVAEIPFSPFRIGEGATPGPPGHVVHAKPGDTILMSYKLQTSWLTDTSEPRDADWQGNVRAGNMYLRVSE